MKKLAIEKTVIILLALAMLLSLVACAEPAKTSDDSQPQSSVKTESEVASVKEETTPEPTAEPTPEPTTSPEELEDEAINDILDGMSIEQMMSQMFWLRFSNTNGYFDSADDEDMISFVQRNMPGGYVLFTGNVTDREQTKAMNEAILANSETPPFIGIDEEGGIVSRLASAGLDGYNPQPAAADMDGTDEAYNVGDYIGAALADIGVLVDFAPDADVLTNPDNTVIGSRSFGSDPDYVADMVVAYTKGLHNNGILASPKHFPGHGGTSGDSHDGSVHIDYDEEHLNSVEYVPFKRSIEQGVDFILVGHILVPNVDDSGLPSSLSPYFVTDVLRNQLGYDGIITTDAMDMGAVADNYAPGEASVLAIKAGIDMVMIPDDYEQALEALQTAVDNGEVTEERIRDSAYRIIRAKYRAGLFD